MASKLNPPQPSDLEMQVLSVLWRQGPSPVRSVLEALPDGKHRAYTTVLSVMQVMEKKGLVDHEKQGNAHVYRPLVTRRQVLRPMMRSPVRNVFGGRPVEAMAALLREGDVSESELSEIRRLIDKAAEDSPVRKDKNS